MLKTNKIPRIWSTRQTFCPFRKLIPKTNYYIVVSFPQKNHKLLWSQGTLKLIISHCSHSVLGLCLSFFEHNHGFWFGGSGVAFFKPHVSLLPLLYFGFLRPHSCVLPTSKVRKLSTMKIDFNRNYIPVTVGRSSTFSCGSKTLFLSYWYICVHFPPNAHSLQTKNKSPQQLSPVIFSLESKWTQC